MLDSEVSDVARRQVAVEMVERRQAFHDEGQRLASRLAARGVLGGGPHLQAVQNLCSAEVKLRARAVWSAISKTLAAGGVRYAPELADDLKREVRQSLHLGDLKHTAANMDRLMRGGSGHIAQQMDREVDQALRAIDAEIDRLVLEVHRRAEADATAANPSPVVLNIQTAGAVVTGSGASVSVVQHFGTLERKMLLRALDVIGKAVRALSDVAGVKPAEIVELTEECRVEAEKDEPNRLRLGSLLAGLATAIQTTAALEPAYRALRAAMLSLGNLMP